MLCVDTDPEELTFTGDGADVLVADVCDLRKYSDGAIAGFS